LVWTNPSNLTITLIDIPVNIKYVPNKDAIEEFKKDTKKIVNYNQLYSSVPINEFPKPTTFANNLETKLALQNKMGILAVANLFAIQECSLIRIVPITQRIQINFV
jgi:hypothetical protein